MALSSYHDKPGKSAPGRFRGRTWQEVLKGRLVNNSMRHVFPRNDMHIVRASSVHYVHTQSHTVFILCVMC